MPATGFSGPSDEPVPGEESRVLVAYLPNVADLTRAEQDGWYRIRSRDTANRLRGGLGSFEYLAFYQPKNFGEEKYCVRRFARIRKLTQVPRIELIPHEPDHSRAQELYYKVDLGPVQVLDQPVVSDRARRILFVPTYWAKLRAAREFNELFVGSYLEELLYKQMRILGLAPEREYQVSCRDTSLPDRPTRSYSLDFALFCRERQLDIETDGDTWHTGPRFAAADNERDNLLEANRWHVLRFNTLQLEGQMDAALSVIREAVNRYGGVKDAHDVVRRFGPDGRLAPGQTTLDLY